MLTNMGEQKPLWPYQLQQLQQQQQKKTNQHLCRMQRVFNLDYS